MGGEKWLKVKCVSCCYILFMSDERGHMEPLLTSGVVRLFVSAERLILMPSGYYGNESNPQTVIQTPAAEGEGEVKTYFDEVFQFLPVQTAVSVSVINFKGPFEFVLQFASKNQMHSCHIFHEVDVTVLTGRQGDGQMNDLH